MKPWYYSTEKSESHTLLFGMIVGAIITAGLFFLLFPPQRMILDANHDGRITMADAVVYEEYRDEVIRCLPIANPSTSAIK